MQKIKTTLQKNTMLVILVFVTLLFQFLITQNGRGSLFAPANITNLISQNAYVVILSTGMLICILTGGNIDLSVGSTVTLVGALAGTLIVQMKLDPIISIVICLIVGVLIGAWQGFWIAYINVPSFIVTLAGMLTFRGIAWILLRGLTISPFPPNYLRFFNTFIFNNSEGKLTYSVALGVILSLIVIVTSIISRASKLRKHYQVVSLASFIIKLIVTCAVVLAATYLLGNDKGIPVILITLGVIVFVYHYLTTNTILGRHLYAVGGNKRAAALSGVNANGVLFFAYANMGFLAAATALVSVARFNSASPSAGNGYELDAIAACYIGGASAYGGVGKVGGAVIGGIFMGVLNNGMSILGIDANWQMTVKGLVLLSAVIFDVVSKNKGDIKLPKGLFGFK